MVLTSGQTQLVVGFLNFISAFGTLIGGEAADAFGRKKTVAICCGLYIFGTAFMALGPTFEVDADISDT